MNVLKLFEKGKGVLAADESNGTCNQRFLQVGIELEDVSEDRETLSEKNGEIRRQYREMLLETPDLEKYISGVILFDETFWQKNSNGESFVESLQKRGIYPGIKIDQGTENLSENSVEKITKGLEDLKERAEKYKENGAIFTKWRAVFQIDESQGLPSDDAISKNAKILAEYAKTVQSLDLIPIVEPEVLLLGEHSLQTSKEITSKVLKKVFEELKRTEVSFSDLILKTSMAIQGNQNADESSAEEIADATVEMLKESVPSEVGGVVFLSGGQTSVEATAHLDKIAELEPLPWPIAFSYARALQDKALQVWQGKSENLEIARQEFLKRLKLNQMADTGDYEIEDEF